MDQDRFLLSLVVLLAIVLSYVFWGADVLVPTYKFILQFVGNYGRGIAGVALMAYFGSLGVKVIRRNVEMTGSTIAKLSDDHANSIRKLIQDGDSLRSQLTKALADFARADGAVEHTRQLHRETQSRLTAISIDNDAFKAEIERLKKLATVSVPAPSDDQQAQQAKLKAMANAVVGNEGG